MQDYTGSDGIVGRIFKSDEEGASAIGLTTEEYLDEISPNSYVDYYYESYISR